MSLCRCHIVTCQPVDAHACGAQAIHEWFELWGAGCDDTQALNKLRRDGGRPGVERWIFGIDCFVDINKLTYGGGNHTRVFDQPLGTRRVSLEGITHNMRRLKMLANVPFFPQFA